MNRRRLLSGVSVSVCGAFAGCLSIGSNACAGETWTGLGYDVVLDSISYDDDTERWVGRCGLSVDFSYVSGGDVGITDAGVALYSEGGHRVGLVSFGDLTWSDVPDDDRSEMDCGGYERGGLGRRGEFAVREFPYYFGLWYGEVRAGAPESRRALAYRGETTPGPGVRPGMWTAVHQDGFPPFPPMPESPPELGDGVETGELLGFSRDCRERRVELTDRYCCDVGIVGSVRPSDPQFVPALERATLTDDGSTAQVEIGVRGYRRPPERSCETPVLTYRVGLSFGGARPDTVEVSHRGVDGNELGRTVLPRED